MNKLGYDLGRYAHEQLTAQKHAATFSMLGMEWDLLDDVWPPQFAPATELFTEWLPYDDADTFLNVGCGSGVTAVVAAMRGYTAVTGLDISSAATANTTMNAARHGVADRVTVLRSDLFAELDQEARFDVVYWNSPFVEAPSDHEMRGPMDYGIFDPGYASHRTFLNGVTKHLTGVGRIFLGFSETMGNIDSLDRLARQAGLRIRTFQKKTLSMPGAEFGNTPTIMAATDTDGMLNIDFRLLELQPDRGAGAPR